MNEIRPESSFRSEKDENISQQKLGKDHFGRSYKHITPNDPNTYKNIPCYMYKNPYLLDSKLNYNEPFLGIFKNPIELEKHKELNEKIISKNKQPEDKYNKEFDSLSNKESNFSTETFKEISWKEVGGEEGQKPLLDCDFGKWLYKNGDTSGKMNCLEFVAVYLVEQKLITKEDLKEKIPLEWDYKLEENEIFDDMILDKDYIENKDGKYQKLITSEAIAQDFLLDFFDFGKQEKTDLKYIDFLEKNDIIFISEPNSTESFSHVFVATSESKGISLGWPNKEAPKNISIKDIVSTLSEDRKENAQYSVFKIRKSGEII